MRRADLPLHDASARTSTYGRDRSARKTREGSERISTLIAPRHERWGDAPGHVFCVFRPVSKIVSVCRESLGSDDLEVIQGVGKVLSSSLLAHLPELGALNRKQIAALAGLAPFNRDCESLHGGRCIWGGRAQVRRVLYMAVVAAVRSNPVIKNFYTQLRARGKYPKSALTACMRKLLVILNAMLHTQTHWHTPALTSSTSALSPFLGAVSDAVAARAPD
jgi:hypothetical protein